MIGTVPSFNLTKLVQSSYQGSLVRREWAEVCKHNLLMHLVKKLKWARKVFSSAPCVCSFQQGARDFFVFKAPLNFAWAWFWLTWCLQSRKVSQLLIVLAHSLEESRRNDVEKIKRIRGKEKTPLHSVQLIPQGAFFLTSWVRSRVQ